MRLLLLKLALILAVAVGFHLWMGPWIGSYQALHNPRTRLLNPVPPQGYQIALAGDSTFTSCCVDAEAQTLWKQLEARTGRKVFPGALDGARALDIMQEAYYLSRVMPKGSVVLVDALPLRDWEDKGRTYKFQLDQLTGNYDPHEADWFLPSLEHALRIRLAPYNFSSLDLRNLPHDVRTAGDPAKLQAFLRENWTTPPSINRVWSRDGDFARERFDKFMDSKRYEQDLNHFGNLARVVETLSRRGIKPVFVLTPFCSELIHAYGGSRDELLLGSLERYRVALCRFLVGQRFAFLDLNGKVPSEGFADCFHTNALGDAILARSIAEYLARVPQ